MTPADYNLKAQCEEGLDNILVVDGVPVIDKSKQDKLLTRISKDFGKKGAPIKPESMFVPWDEKTSKSKGCATIRKSWMYLAN